MRTVSTDLPGHELVSEGLGDLEAGRESTSSLLVSMAAPRLRALPALKEQLGVNIELASPPDFVPELPGWRERSPLVFGEGNVEVRHFDFYSQALSKIERGFRQDLDDVAKMVESGLVEPKRLFTLYETIEPELYRYPAIDPAVFRQKVEAMLGSGDPRDDA